MQSILLNKWQQAPWWCLALWGARELLSPISSWDSITCNTYVTHFLFGLIILLLACLSACSHRISRTKSNWVLGSHCIAANSAVIHLHSSHTAPIFWYTFAHKQGSESCGHCMFGVFTLVDAFMVCYTLRSGCGTCAQIHVQYKPLSSALWRPGIKALCEHTWIYLTIKKVPYYAFVS